MKNNMYGSCRKKIAVNGVKQSSPSALPITEIALFRSIH